MNANRFSNINSHAFLMTLCLILISSSPRSLLADITISGAVAPATVTTGTVTGESVFIGDPDFTGSLTVDGGSSLLVDNVNGSSGISLFYNAGNLTVSGAGTSVDLNARTTLRLDNGASALINDGAYLLLNGSDTRPSSASFNRGRALDMFGNSTITIDGAGTQVDFVRRLRLSGAQMNVTNGASVDMDGTDSSNFTSFVLGQNGTHGGLTLDGSATMASLVPLALWGVGGGSTATVEVLDFSDLELTASLTIGGGGNGQATMNITDSTFTLLEFPASPVFLPGSIDLGPAGTGEVNVVRGLLDVENHIFVSQGTNVGISGSLNMNDNSSALVGGNLYISHNGVDGIGRGMGYVLTCDSTLNATETFIGENGELAGTTVNGNITVEGGTLSPGCSPGVMTVSGNVDFVGGRLVIEVDGVSAIDQLNVVGSTTFAGNTVVLSFGNGFAPPLGSSFEVDDYLTSGSTSGLETTTFTIEGLQGPGGAEFKFEVDADGTIVTTTDAVPEFVEALIDIRPSGRNHVDTSVEQSFPVAILSTQDVPIFDATEVDPATVAFGPAGAATRENKTKLKDVDKDGDTDMIVWFLIQQTGIACGDESATMTGQTFAGTDFVARDVVITQGCE